MKLNSVIVLYNPSDEFLVRYKEMVPYFNGVFFIDNSTAPNEKIVEEIKQMKNANYVSLNGNQGIAFALKVGMKKALENNPDYVLTLDQDSRFPIEKMETLKEILQKETDGEFGIIGLNVNSTETDLKIKEVPWIITSGNFINVNYYKKLNSGFNEQLFIDGVDQDFCHRFHQAGYKIGMIPGISLEHQIGNPVYHRILWKKFSTFNYPVFRYYYMFRNYYYLHKQDRDFYKKEFRKIKYYQTFKILFYEKNKKAKFRAAKLGKKDAKKGILGPCKHEL